MRKIAIAIGAILITVVVQWYSNHVPEPKAATWDGVVNEANRGGYRLIKTEELWKGYSKNPDKLLVVDTRQEWEYRTGHIKGALNFPMEPTWLSRWRKKGDLKAFLGPEKNRSIVFY